MDKRNVRRLHVALQQGYEIKDYGKKAGVPAKVWPDRGVKFNNVKLLDDGIGKYVLVDIGSKAVWVDRKCIQFADYQTLKFMQINEREAFRLGLIPWVFPPSWDFGGGLRVEEYSHYEIAPVWANWVVVDAIRRDEWRTAGGYRVLVQGLWCVLRLQSVVRVEEYGGRTWVAVHDWVVKKHGFLVSGRFTVQSYRKKSEFQTGPRNVLKRRK
jgi:hypothetical protein